MTRHFAASLHGGGQAAGQTEHAPHKLLAEAPWKRAVEVQGDLDPFDDPGL